MTNMIYRLENIESDDVQLFCDSMQEYFDDFREELMDHEFEEECEEYVDIDPDDYGNELYDYETKAKAKIACKEAVCSMVSDIRKEVLSNLDDYFATVESYCNGLQEMYHEFEKDLFAAYDTCASIDTDEDTQQIIMEKKQEYFSYVDAKGMDVDGMFPRNMKQKLERTIEQSISIRELLGECEYDAEDEYYCYDLNSACDTVNSIMADILSDLETNMPDQINEVYKEKFYRNLEELENELHALFD